MHPRHAPGAVTSAYAGPALLGGADWLHHAPGQPLSARPAAPGSAAPQAGAWLLTVADPPVLEDAKAEQGTLSGPGDRAGAAAGAAGGAGGALRGVGTRLLWEDDAVAVARCAARTPGEQGQARLLPLCCPRVPGLRVAPAVGVRAAAGCAGWSQTLDANAGCAASLDRLSSLVASRARLGPPSRIHASKRPTKP